MYSAYIWQRLNNIHPGIINRVLDFVTGRPQRVSIPISSTDSTQVHVLSPILFLLHWNMSRSPWNLLMIWPLNSLTGSRFLTGVSNCNISDLDVWNVDKVNPYAKEGGVKNTLLQSRWKVSQETRELRTKSTRKQNTREQEIQFQKTSQIFQDTSKQREEISKQSGNQRSVQMGYLYRGLDSGHEQQVSAVRGGKVLSPCGYRENDNANWDKLIISLNVSKTKFYSRKRKKL